jgi:hypothetical protein
MTKPISQNAQKLKQYYQCHLCHQYLANKHFYKSSLLTRNYKCCKCHQKQVRHYAVNSPFETIRYRAYQFEWRRGHKISSVLVRNILTKFEWKSIISGETTDLVVCRVYKDTNLSEHNSMVISNKEYKQYTQICDQNQALAFLPAEFVQKNITLQDANH